MKRWLGWLVASFVLVMASSFAWTHRHHVAMAVAVPGTQAPAPATTSEEERAAQQAVTIAGPMAEYMTRQSPAGRVETLAPYCV